MVALNPAFTRMTGYTAEEAVGRNCRFLQGSQTDPQARPASGPRSRRGRAAFRNDGNSFWNRLFIPPVHDESGALRYFFGNQLDITVPDWFVDLSFGRTHVDPKLEAEFHAVLGEVGDADRAHALDRIVAAAHRLAEIKVRLTPGALAGAWTMRD